MIVIDNVKEKGMKIKEILLGNRKEKQEIRNKQIKVAQITLDNVYKTAEEKNFANVPYTKEEIETAREAARLLHEAEKADLEKYECWTKIGTMLVKTAVYVGLGVLTFELNKQMTLLVFNEQFSKGSPIDRASLSNLLKANDNLKRDIMNNLNKKDGIL